MGLRAKFLQSSSMRSLQLVYEISCVDHTSDLKSIFLYSYHWFNLWFVDLSIKHCLSRRVILNL